MFYFCCFLTKTLSFNLCSTSYARQYHSTTPTFSWYWFWSTNLPSRILMNKTPPIFFHIMLPFFSNRHPCWGETVSYTSAIPLPCRAQSFVDILFFVDSLCEMFCFIFFLWPCIDCPYFVFIDVMKFLHSFKQQIQIEFFTLCCCKKLFKKKYPWTFSLFLPSNAVCYHEPYNSKINSYKILAAQAIAGVTDLQKVAKIILESTGLDAESYRLGNSKAWHYLTHILRRFFICLITRQELFCILKTSVRQIYHKRITQSKIRRHFERRAICTAFPPVLCIIPDLSPFILSSAFCTKTQKTGYSVVF